MVEAREIMNRIYRLELSTLLSIQASIKATAFYSEDPQESFYLRTVHEL